MMRLRDANGRLRTPDARLGVGLALVAVSVFGGLRLSGAAAPTQRVLALRSSVATGHRFTATDLEEVAVHVDRRVARTLVPASLRADVIGRPVQHAVRAGALLEVGALARRRGDTREITVPVTPEHALGGELEPGDRVDVVATFDATSDAARTLTVAGGAEVVSVVRGDQVFGGSGALSALTLAVPSDEAMVLVYAMRTGAVDILRSAETPGARTRIDGTEVL
jgi:Flp pilus assembly protein CpaB